MTSKPDHVLRRCTDFFPRKVGLLALSSLGHFSNYSDGGGLRWVKLAQRFMSLEKEFSELVSLSSTLKIMMFRMRYMRFSFKSTG